MLRCAITAPLWPLEALAWDFQIGAVDALMSNHGTTWQLTHTLQEKLVLIVAKPPYT